MAQAVRLIQVPEGQLITGRAVLVIVDQVVQQIQAQVVRRTLGQVGLLTTAPVVLVIMDQVVLLIRDLVDLVITVQVAHATMDLVEVARALPSANLVIN
jgi:hypothetical protein